MTILCIAEVSHDTNFTIYKDNKFYYFSAERFYNYKKATMSFEEVFVKSINFLKKNFNDRTIDLIVISLCDTGTIFFKKNTLFEKINISSLFYDKNNINDIPVYILDHHYAHVLSSKALNDKANVGIAIDGAGCFGRGATIFKNLNDINHTEFFPLEKKAIGAFFTNLALSTKTKKVGKLMGLQSYGKMETDFYNDLNKIGLEKEDEMEEKLYQSFYDLKLDKNENFDKVFTAHQFAVDGITKLFYEYFNKTEDIAYGGGCALSIPANTKLLKEGFNITVCPAANDSGISIGCLKFADILLNLNIDFSNIEFSYGDKDVGYADDKLIKIAATLLAKGKIIGWCQGFGEAGPRALGHRSFLMNPSIVNGKDFINDKIKHREWWRPFGGSIIKTDVLKQYVPSNLDKYMLRSFEFKDEFKEKFQSIIHVDNTSRLQIVDNSNSVFYKLINEFYKLTGIPGVLNTSYNLGGYPIANTRDNIIKVFNGCDDLNFLFIGNKLISK